MKKFIIALFIVLTANFACKKEGIDSGACGCTVLAEPVLRLAVKNVNGEDLLNSKTVGAININQIELYRLNVNGSREAIAFDIRPSFTYGNNQIAYAFNQIQSPKLVSLATNVNQKFYLKLGNMPALELNLEVDSKHKKINKVFANQKEVSLENEEIVKFVGPIFYLVL